MTQAKQGLPSTLWIALAGLTLGLAAWLLLSTSEADDAVAAKPAAYSAQGREVAQRRVLEAQDAARGRVRIAEEGRLPIDLGELPAQGPLLLALDLGEELRGSGARSVRVISQYGDRLDATATPLEGAASGVELAIDSTFLKAGRYLIEVDTEGPHPLKLRRYVLEVE